MADLKYSPKLPLDVDNEGNFIYLKDIYSNIKQKLKMLFLTSPGEKIMDPAFGIGIKKYLFEHSSVVTKNIQANGDPIYLSNDLKSVISENIYNQVNLYLKDVNIENLEISIDENILYIMLEYSYRNYLQDTFEMQISL